MNGLGLWARLCGQSAVNRCFDDTELVKFAWRFWILLSLSKLLPVLARLSLSVCLKKLKPSYQSQRIIESAIKQNRLKNWLKSLAKIVIIKTVGGFVIKTQNRQSPTVCQI